MICSNCSLSSRNFTDSLSWVKPKNVDLTKILKVGDSFHSCGYITLDKTTNRTKKPGDDIFSTPAMIFSMSKTVLTKVNDLLPSHYSSLTTKVTCQHRAPMSLGEHYNINAKVTKVEPISAEFDVDCQNDEKKLIGKANIKIGIVGY